MCQGADYSRLSKNTLHMKENEHINTLALMKPPMIQNCLVTFSLGFMGMRACMVRELYGPLFLQELYGQGIIWTFQNGQWPREGFVWSGIVWT